MNDYLCLCAHEYTDHRVGVGLEPCTHSACGCNRYRLDYRSPVLGETAEDTAEGAA